MQLYRNHRLPRRAGCLPLTLVVGFMFGIVVASVAWLGGRLGLPLPYSTNALSAGQQAFDRGDLNSAVERAAAAWEDGSSQGLMLLVRALVYRSYHDYDRDPDRSRALEITAAAVEDRPFDLDVLASHAFALGANGQPVEAVRQARWVLDREPDHTLARLALSLAYGGVGSHERGLRESRIAAAAGELAVDVQRALAVHLGNLGRFDEALEAADHALRLNNRLLLLHFEQALYARQISDEGTATTAYLSVLALDPDNVKARLRLCELASLLAERDNALRYCHEVTERAPTWAEGWYHLGREYFLLGQFREAQRTLNRCTTLQIGQGVPVEERQFECWYLQGQAAENLGDCDALLRTYEEFQAMAAVAALPQTWTYPPEGPPICAGR